MIEREANGVKRGFKFGTYTFKLLAESTGVTDVNSVFKSLQTGDIGFLTSFYFACAKHYCLTNKQKVDFDEVELSDWLDELGLEGTSEIFSELIKTYRIKNSKAPETAGQEETAEQPSMIGTP